MALGKIKADTLEHSTAGSLDTSYVVNGSAKAWITFNGSGTIAIRDSHNIASISDGANGLYGVNFTSTMSTANYSSICNRASFASTTAGGANACTVTSGSITKLQSYDSNGSLGDRDNITSHVLGDLA